MQLFVTATSVRVPRPQAFVSSLSRSVDTENAVVEVRTDEGLIVIGEICIIWDRNEKGQSEDVNDLLADALKGRDLFRISEINALMHGLLQRSYPAKAGVEMALYDQVGKALNTPVYNLLGRMVRDRLLLIQSLTMGPTDQVAEHAAGLVGKGYNVYALFETSSDFVTCGLALIAMSNPLVLFIGRFPFLRFVPSFY